MARLAEQIAQRIKHFRTAKGLLQEDMEELGLSYKYFQRIEQGKANLTLATLEKVAVALEIEVADLFILPLDDSPEVNELVASVSEIIRKGDREVVRKLNVVIRDVL